MDKPGGQQVGRRQQRHGPGEVSHALEGAQLGAAEGLEAAVGSSGCRGGRGQLREGEARVVGAERDEGRGPGRREINDGVAVEVGAERRDRVTWDR